MTTQQLSSLEPEAEALLQRVKHALAEAGYPDVEPIWYETSRIISMYTDPGPAHRATALHAWCPAPIGWMAVEVAGCPDVPCWPCTAETMTLVGRQTAPLYNNTPAADCRNGQCHHPGERRWPPTELLRRAAP